MPRPRASPLCRKTAITGRLIPPVTASGGVGLIDFDNDGWLDVYAVQGGPFPPDPKSTAAGDRLFRNAATAHSRTPPRIRNRRHAARLRLWNRGGRL